MALMIPDDHCSGSQSTPRCGFSLILLGFVHFSSLNSDTMRFCTHIPTKVTPFLSSPTSEELQKAFPTAITETLPAAARAHSPFSAPCGDTLPLLCIPC